MNITRVIKILCLIASCQFVYGFWFLPQDPNQTLLPSPFPVYTNGRIAVNHPYGNFEKKMLPTNNDYQKNPGCYVACYSRDPNGAIYAAGKTIFVKGQIRVPGKYVNRVCQPTGYTDPKYGSLQYFKDLCNQKISTCKDCWAGGDTGGWFGIQPSI